MQVRTGTCYSHDINRNTILTETPYPKKKFIEGGMLLKETWYSQKDGIRRKMVFTERWYSQKPVVLGI